MRAVFSAFVCLTMLGPIAVHAADGHTSAAALLSASCTGCHTTQPDSGHAIPSLEGLYG